MGPSFVANGTACCDVGIADGGHYDDVPLSDLSTFVEGSQRSMCAAKPTLLFVDEVFYRLEGAKKPVLSGTEYTNITQAVTSLLARPHGETVQALQCCGFIRGAFCTAYTNHATSPRTSPFTC